MSFTAYWCSNNAVLENLDACTSSVANSLGSANNQKIKKSPKMKTVNVSGSQ